MAVKKVMIWEGSVGGGYTDSITLQFDKKSVSIVQVRKTDDDDSGGTCIVNFPRRMAKKLRLALKKMEEED